MSVSFSHLCIHTLDLTFKVMSVTVREGGGGRAHSRQAANARGQHFFNRKKIFILKRAQCAFLWYTTEKIRAQVETFSHLVVHCEVDTVLYLCTLSSCFTKNLTNIFLPNLGVVASLNKNKQILFLLKKLTKFTVSMMYPLYFRLFHYY